MNKSNIQKKDIKKSFNLAAETYDQAAVLQREVADRLLERLDFVKINPKVILDLGSGTSYAALALEKRYKKAKIIALDLAENMLLHSKKNKRWFDRKRYICADAEYLPLADNSVDFIFSNLVLHWVSNLEQAVAEMHRVLKPNGLLLFSALGPDTLYEIRQSWQDIDSTPHVHTFLDMHNIGDNLLKAAFKDPVMDMEFITLNYNELKKILIDLKDLGTHNIATSRFKGMTGKSKFDKFAQEYEKHRSAEGLLPVTYEIIYGLGWGQKLSDNKEFAIPISSIQGRKKSDL